MTLKIAITIVLTLIQIDYLPRAEGIILIVDLSGTKLGAILNQLNKKDKHHLYRFKSGI